MLSDEVRARIGQIHRSNFSAAPDLSPLPSPRLAPLPRDDDSSSWERLLKAAEECENASGRHLRFRRPLELICPGISSTLGPTSGESGSADEIHAELQAVGQHFPGGTLFLDLETCGFAGSPVFLAGLVWHDRDVLVVDQLFARNYAEERAVLETLWQVAARHCVLVTFNGKSFDWPMVHDRSTRHHLKDPARIRMAPRRRGKRSVSVRANQPQALDFVHCDLLHHARRRWRRVLPDCRLQTLERYVCKRWRSNDLPGSQVPTAYHEFVRRGETEAVGGIMQHNARDLATLVELTLKLLAA
jgi:uncharacterized protein YprB with RNaseH-like and TPR domain